MVVLLGIAFLAGVITAVSPCVLPVLPIVLAGGASGGRRRPYAIIAGLLTSFVVSILLVAWILHELGLPQDLLRNVSIGLLFLVAAVMLVPKLGQLIEAPLSRIAHGPSSDLGGGFVLGLALGLVFVPCGGPILAYVSAQAASLDLGLKPVLTAIAYGLGASVVLLLIAVGGSRGSAPLRRHAPALRAWLGVIVAASAFALVFNVDTRLQTALPNWTHFLQTHTEETAYARKKIGRESVTSRKPVRVEAGALPDYGAAPNFAGIDHWLNSQPLTVRHLRGKVVLIDFWTYSCINCLRTLPYLKAWYGTYAKDGFVIVGVHTPEFAFEHVLSNVRRATHDLGIRYPVALDNEYGTWNSWQNEYWPAEYLIDRSGHVREGHFGEGNYAETEHNIRTLLAERSVRLPNSTDMADHTPTGEITPETYLGYERLDLTRYRGQRVKQAAAALYLQPATLAQNEYAYGGVARVESQRLIAIRDTSIRLHFHARDVYIVLGGHGTVRTYVDGKPSGRFGVTQDRLYTAVSYPRIEDRLLELRLSPGVEAYSFTFG
jgi:cytochrome c biogenesis protein CcdA/thiol-disulfide isomerase/thioredoxin